MEQQQKPTSLYIVRGGIGKSVIFSTMIEKLAARDGGKISVATGFPGVFKFHPQVAHVLDNSSEEFLQKVGHRFDDIVFREPYVSSYCKGDRHILDEWPRLYGIEPFAGGGVNTRPDLALGKPFLDEAAKVRAQIDRPYFIVQWTGGQPPQNLRKSKKYPDNKNTRGRNILNYPQIWQALGEAYPDHLFLLYALPNEPVRVPASLNGRVARVNARSLSYAALLREADGFVALDSSLQHFAAARQVGKKGVVLWGKRTTPGAIGYAFHTNLVSPSEEGVVIPPAEVVAALGQGIASH